MIFHSLDFLAFFIVTLAAYWSLPMRGQNLLLLAASYLFYGWVHPWFLLLIFATTFIDYWSARNMARRPEQKLAWLWLSIITNFGMLGFFKYFGFFAENVAAVAASVGWHVPPAAFAILLPVGISFYTFQSMSYTIDVYRNHAAARTSFVDMAAFVSFFPHLVAGPIMRATNLLPQFERERRFSAAAARDATVLMVWGFFKKLVIADNVGVIANKVFALESPEFPVLWAGVFAFAIQIYADFSAYTDIARGVAKWFGFDLIRNFEHPYLAASPSEFWHRWNISLSTWFRDYVYIPLGGSRVGAWRVATNIMITFLASGLWHGASWNYVLWGAYHGALLVIDRMVGSVWSPTDRARRSLRIVQVPAMFVLTCIGWLIFRETDLPQLIHHVQLNPWGASAPGVLTGSYLFLLALLYSVPLWVQDLWAELHGPDLSAAIERAEALVSWRRTAAQAAVCGVMVAAIVVLRSQAALDFIYFAF
ncbi:MAG: MBOAT family O-acyltransferase [Vicinamibacterales bacterium]